MCRAFERIATRSRPRHACESPSAPRGYPDRRTHMYRPKFCAECSAKIIRLRWHLWTSRRFCQRCSPQFMRDQVKRALFTGATIFCLGVAVGQAARTAPPPLVIQRSQNAILPGNVGKASGPNMVDGSSGSVPTANATGLTSNEEVYSCGARTRKGSACSRRVHGPVRCWQHLGLPAMLPQEQLRIKAK